MSLANVERLIDRLTPAFFLAPVFGLAVATLALFGG
jgi:hypothetical protein